MAGTEITVLVGTTKGAFLLRGGNTRTGWKVEGPFCDGAPVNHVVGDPKTGRLWAGGGGDFHGGPREVGKGSQPPGPMVRWLDHLTIL